MPPETSLPHKSSSLGSLTEDLQEQAQVELKVTLIAKFGKERIALECLSSSVTIGEVKEMLQERTRILPKRQKLVGLVAAKGGAKAVVDELTLAELKVKKNTGSVLEHQFILMGTPEEEIFIDPGDLNPDELPDVIDDFELDFNAGSDEWLQHVANKENLKSFTEKTAVHIMNPPRPGKPLLVLDLDHTLLDFSSRQLQQGGHAIGDQLVANMKRPYMDEFLTTVYPHYDLVVWSQTSWRWLETKLTELGMVTHPGYRFCFVLDKTSMFTVVSTKRDGTSVEHHVKPLQIIWAKFPQWGSHNTVHVDDLSRNFALNLGSGLKCKAYFRKRSSARRDSELLGLGRYLVELATANTSFDSVNFSRWMDVVSGKYPLLERKEEEDDDMKTDL